MIWSTSVQFRLVQSPSRVRLFATPWITARQASLSITNSRSSLKRMSIESVMPSSHVILYVPFSSCPQSFPTSGSFQMSQSFWSFSFNVSPSNEHPGLFSFRMDWLDLLAVRVTFKSLLLHHRSKASILQRSAFFIVHFSHPYMTTGKTIASTRWTFADKVMSLLFNKLSRLVITFFPRSKRLLISWLKSASAVILEPPKIKSATVSPSICHEVMGPDAMILSTAYLVLYPVYSAMFNFFIHIHYFVLNFIWNWSLTFYCFLYTLLTLYTLFSNFLQWSCIIFVKWNKPINIMES